jgi:hypothetical protein
MAIIYKKCRKTTKMEVKNGKSTGQADSAMYQRGYV